MNVMLLALLFLPFRVYAADMDMVVVSSGDTLNLPIIMSNLPKSQGLLHPQLSVIAPEFLVLISSTPNELGPTEIPVGSSWTTNISFLVSTSAPIGCTAIAYSLEFPIGEFVPDNAPYHFQKIFITPSPAPRAMKELKQEKAACSKRAAKVDWNWRWKYARPRLLPQQYMPTRDIPLIPDARTTVGQSLPRGEFGFALGATLAQVDANALKRGLEREPDSNVSVRPEQWRLFKALRDPEISAFTLFLRDGPVDEIGIHYGPKFEVIRERLRKKLGKEMDSEDFEINMPANGQSLAEHRHYQSAYWWDCRTLIQLQSQNSDSLELKFNDLKPGSTINIGIIGRSGRRHSFSGCNPE